MNTDQIPPPPIQPSPHADSSQITLSKKYVESLFPRKGIEAAYIPSWDRREIARLADGACYQAPVLEHGSDIVLGDYLSSLKDGNRE